MEEEPKQSALRQTSTGVMQTARFASRWLVYIGIMVSVGAFLLLLGGLFIYQIGYRPLPSEEIDVSIAPWASPESMELTGDTFKVLSLNLNHGAGTKHMDVEHGDYEELSSEAVTSALDRVIRLVRDEAVDVVVLQSVDFGSRFAGERDQAEYIAGKLKYGYVARARMWKHPYLPFPDPLAGEMVGPMDTGLAIVSRIPISNVKRFSLGKETLGNWWKSTFASNFCVLKAELSAAKKHFVLLNTSLTSGDMLVRERQAREVARLVGQESNGYAILSGTFFASPKDTSLLGMKRLDYTLDLVRHRMNFQVLFADRDVTDAIEQFATYEAADGTLSMIDHVLVEKGVRVKSLRILGIDPPLSTHRPLLLEIIP